MIAGKWGFVNRKGEDSFDSRGSQSLQICLRNHLIPMIRDDMLIVITSYGIGRISESQLLRNLVAKTKKAPASLKSFGNQ